MKRALVLSAVLGLALAGCKTMEPRPEPPAGGGDCTAPGGPAPTPPPVQPIPDSGMVPPPPKSTNIVVGLCPATGQYTAMGVDTQTRQFTFLYQGGRATQATAFSRFYEARVPVTVYTAPVRLTARGPVPVPAPAPAPTPIPGSSPAPTDPGSPRPPPDDGSDDSGSDPLFDPCVNISEEPPPSPKPGGSIWIPTYLRTFTDVSWNTAHALDAVTDPAALSTVPGTAPIPR